MALIKASEIGEYVFCERAWWLHHVVGETPAGAARRTRGIELHTRHSRAVRGSTILLRLGVVLLIAAFVSWLWFR